MSLLPGWHPGFVASSRLTVISHVLSATSTSGTILLPAGILAGDLIVLGDFAENSSGAPGSVVPAGFSPLNEAASGIRKQIVSYRQAAASDAGATVTGMNGSNANGKVAIIFRGNVPAVTITPSSTRGGEATTGDPAAQLVAASTGLAPLVVIGAYGASSAFDTRSMTPARDGELGSGNGRTFLAWKIFNTAPLDVLVDMPDQGANFMQSFYLQLS